MGVVVPRSRAAVDQVVVVFKTHFDIGYTDMASNVVQRYRTTMIDQALEVVDRNRDLPADQQFVWTLSGWPLKQIGADWPGQDPVRRKRVADAFRSGRFVVHALPFTMHTETLEPEDLVRGLEFSSRLSRGAGLPLPRDAKMTDVPCHSWILPTLLTRAGVDFLHLGCNAASRSPSVPALFFWEGPDGSRLLTMYTAESYGTGLVPPKDWPYRTWLALIHTGDNHGPPTPEEVRKLLAEAAEKLPGVKVRIGRLSDFSDAILTEKAAVPVVRGDMPDTWIHGPMCDPEGARRVRWARPALESAEILQTLLRWRGVPVQDATASIAEAREQSLLYGEHTWGGALWWLEAGSDGQRLLHGDAFRGAQAAGRFARSEASWAEHSAYAGRAESIVTRVLAEQRSALALNVAVEGPRVVVFNPLPWTRDAFANVPGLPARFLKATPADGNGSHGEPIVAGSEGSGFLARSLPALGYRTFNLSESAPSRSSRAARAEGTTLENRWVRLEFDASRMAVRSWVDKAGGGREWVDAGSEYGFGQFVHERFSADDVGAFVKAYVKITADWATNELGKPNLPSASVAPHRVRVPMAGRLRTENDAAGATIILDGAAHDGMPAVTARWRLLTDQPFVDLEMTVHDKPADPWPEACWIALPFGVDEPRFRVGRPGSIIDPARDIVRGANRNLFMVQTGVAIHGNDGAGVGVCPLDSGLVSLDEPGCWKYAPDFVPRRPSVFVNLYNNQWTTNFRLWNGGTWTSRVRLWTYGRGRGQDGAEALVTPSLEARYPVIAAYSDGPAGTLARRMEGLSVSRRGILVTALDGGSGSAAGGGNVTLRLWELAGRGGPCRIRAAEGLLPRGIRPTDLRGEDVGKSTAGSPVDITIEVPAYAPVTLRGGGGG